MNRVTVALLLALTLLSIPLAAAEYGSVATIFDLSPSARVSGMGGAFLALADDASAAFYNPAGLGWISDVSVSSLFARQFGAVDYASLQFALPYLGATFLYLDSGPIEGNTGTFRYTSAGAVISSGISIGPIGIGARFKVYRQMDPDSGAGWTFDPAILVVTSIVRAGFLLENAFSSPIEFSDHSEQWTPRTRIGVALTLSPATQVGVNAVVEAVGLFSASPLLTAGLETYVNGMAARIGYDGYGVTFGLSGHFSIFEIDWAYITRSAFPDTNRVSLTFRF
jgi:hypothetical protein